MKETTVYESEDGRRFESADECLQWEQALVQIRKIRQKLWEAKAHHMRTVKLFGEDYIRGEIGSECTDDCDLYDTQGEGMVEGEIAARLGNLRSVVPAEAIAYLDFIKRSYEFAFGDYDV